MAIDTWTGTADGDFGNASNWTGDGPDDGDSLIYNDQATAACDTDCDADSNGHTYAQVAVTRGYNYALGASGDALDPTAITVLCWESGFAGVSYISGAITDGTVNSPGGGTLQLSGETTRLHVTQGVVQYTSTASFAASSYVSIDERGGGTSLVIIDAGINATDYANLEVRMEGGELRASSTVPTLRVYGGTAMLDGSATCTALEVGVDGRFVYRTSGNITTVHNYGYFDASDKTREKTITTMHAYDGSTVDLSSGGDFLTISNFWAHGRVNLILGAGTKVAI